MLHRLALCTLIGINSVPAAAFSTVPATLLQSRCTQPARPRVAGAARAGGTYPPDNYHREAARVISNLKGNAALLAAFSFSALTAKELPGASGGSLQDVYVVFACLTLALELVAVFVGQQLLYQMADGSFGLAREDGSADPDRTILSILLTNHRAEFYTVRTSFLLGILTMMCAIAVRAWAQYEPPLAAAVTLVFFGAGGVMAFFSRSTSFLFERVRLLDAAPSSVRESFVEADRDGDSRLSAEEVARALRRCGADVGPEELRNVMARCGADGEGATLDYAGFSELIRLLRTEGIDRGLGECNVE